MLSCRECDLDLCMKCGRCPETTNAFFKKYKAQQVEKAERASRIGRGRDGAGAEAKARPRGDSAPAKPKSSLIPLPRTSQRGKSAPTTSPYIPTSDASILGSAAKASERLQAHRDGESKVDLRRSRTPLAEVEETPDDSDSPSPTWGRLNCTDRRQLAQTT